MDKNPVQHEMTKHIDVRHHFLRDNVKNNNVVMNYYKTEYQVADIFTNPLSKENFIKNRLKLTSNLSFDYARNDRYLCLFYCLKLVNYHRVPYYRYKLMAYLLKGSSNHNR